MKDICILIVDDQVSIRQMIASILRRDGYTNLNQAENGKRAIRAMQEQQVDLIILDWDMPVMTGLEVLQWLKGKEQDANLLKLMLTARAAKENIVEAVKFGADNYIVKPFSPNTLLSKVAELVKDF
jgi:two-component system chemotaxis response regulator CheY